MDMYACSLFHAYCIHHTHKCTFVDAGMVACELGRKKERKNKNRREKMRADQCVQWFVKKRKEALLM